MRIPLPKMMRHWREREFERHMTPAAARHALGFWAWLAARPRLYGAVANFATRALRLWARGRGALVRVPFAGGWTAERDLPVPEGRSFQAQWQRRGGAR